MAAEASSSLLEASFIIGAPVWQNGISVTRTTVRLTLGMRAADQLQVARWREEREEHENLLHIARYGNLAMDDLSNIRTQ